MSPLRAGVIGTGMIGSLHCRAARLAGAELAGVAASSPDRATDAAVRLGAQRAHESAQSLIADDAIDVVHICTPNRHHLPLATQALAAGKHVICEKPIGVSEQEARLLLEAVRRSGRVFSVPFVYRYYPMVVEARQRIHDGDMGALQLIHGGFLQGWLARPGDTNWRVDPAQGGPSRAFADIGSHWCDLIEFVTGHRIATLIATTHVAVPTRGRREVSTEDIALVQFRTDSGAVGSMIASQISHGPKNRLHFRIDGRVGSLAFEQERPDSLLIGRTDGSVTVLPRDPAVLSPDASRYSLLPPGHPQGFHDCFDQFVAETYDAIGGDGEPPATLPGVGDGLRAAQLTDAVLHSARDGLWVDVLPAGGSERRTFGLAAPARP